MGANQPILIKDLASMFRKRVGKNERPMEGAVLTLNNEKVDKWYHDVLIKIADQKGSIPCGRAADCLRFFTEGLEINQMQKYKDCIPTYDPKIVDFWINFLKESEIEELYEAGISVVSIAWSVISGAIKMHFMNLRWDLVYSKSEDPVVWDKLANDNPHPMHGRPLPFGLALEDLKEMNDKVMIIMNSGLQPKE